MVFSDHLNYLRQASSSVRSGTNSLLARNRCAQESPMQVISLSHVLPKYDVARGCDSRVEIGEGVSSKILEEKGSPTVGLNGFCKRLTSQPASQPSKQKPSNSFFESVVGPTRSLVHTISGSPSSHLPLTPSFVMQPGASSATLPRFARQITSLG